MIWLRVLILAFAFLCIIYYTMLVAQLANFIKFTKREITFFKGLVPFYFWIVPQEEIKKRKKSKI
jgi:hypothetical protein